MNDFNNTKIAPDMKNYTFIPVSEHEKFFENITDKNGYLNELIRNELMPTQNLIMYKLSEYLAMSEAIGLNNLNEEQKQLYKAVDLCYNVLGRTTILSNAKISTPQEFREAGLEDGEVREFSVQENQLADEIIRKL